LVCYHTLTTVRLSEWVHSCRTYIGLVGYAPCVSLTRDLCRLIRSPPLHSTSSSTTVLPASTVYHQYVERPRQRSDKSRDALVAPSL